MTKEENKFVYVKGHPVRDLTPDMNRPLALVDLDVLIRLASNLKRTDVRMIKSDLLSDIRNVGTKLDSKEALQTLVFVCSEFVAFHQTVNLIQEIPHELNIKKHKLDDEPITGTNLDEL